ncbi:hypothetical protein CTI12_AA177610 [Artemisia annua]|uniref:Stress induced protein n=1 Tax=Artemisia annua TaxID=35608 RepID=A0A2U1P8Q9_ARTAN|nr:hypothetical protein CTI12_AA177610 [Artemisia annua]
MAKQQGFDMSKTTPPSMIMEHEQEGNDMSHDYYNYEDDEMVNSNGCGCFRLFSHFDTRHHGEESASFINHRRGDVLDNESWLMSRFMRLKEFSEFVAGPKWKNFIRKFSKKPRKGNSSFQYDPQSYALNFNGDSNDDDLLPRSFSTRFAPHSGSMAS